MLSRFRARGFKSLGEVELELSPLVVLFGPNSAGKSNLLEAMILLSRVATKSTFTEAFQEPLRGRPHEAFTLPATGVSGLLRQESVTLGLGADILLSAGSPLPGLRYHVGIDLKPKSGELRLADEGIAHLHRDGTASDEHDAQSLVVKHGWLQAINRQVLSKEMFVVDPLLEPLGVGHTSVANMRFSGEFFPEWDALRAEFASWRSYYLDPRDAMRREQAPQEVTDIGARGELLAPLLWSLKNTNEGRAFKAVERTLRAAIPSMDKLDVELDERRGSLEIFVTQGGTPFSSRVISEGTLRLLALCALAASPQQRGLVAFEEPENGVHPRRLEVIANLLEAMARRGKQVVVTTHSSQLAGLLARRQREQDDGTIRLVAVSHDGHSTRLRPFQASSALLDDAEIREALAQPSEDGLLQAMMIRGWLDG